MTQRLLVLQGTPGSGKSTLANYLAAQDINTVVVCTDDLLYDENGTYKFDPALHGARHKRTQAKAASLLAKGLSVICANTNIHNWECKPYVAAAVALGVPVEFVRCNGKFANVHGVPDEKVREMRSRMEDLSVERALTAKAPWELAKPYFYLTNVHPDWYEEGPEFCPGKGGKSYGDNLWRLDFKVEDNEYQAQVFVELGCSEKEYDDQFGGTDKPVPYIAARLFIERDNRIPGGDGERWDYACKQWELDKDQTLFLLTAPSVNAVGLMMDHVREVAALPNDRAFISGDWRWESPSGLIRKQRVEEYWAQIDAKAS